MTETLRKIEVLEGNCWVETRLHLIKKGQRFRLWENGCLVFHIHRDRNTFVAKADASEDGVIVETEDDETHVSMVDPFCHGF